jgi:glycosyltransferase involved in cell wall biosynthesis
VYINSPYHYLKNSDLFLFTSVVEGFSLVICVALCFGVPVISRRCAGPNEILQNGKLGILTNYDDDYIYINIQNLIDNSNLRNHFQKMGLERAKLFDLEKSMSNIYTLL